MNNWKRLFASLTLLVYLAGGIPIARAEGEDEIDADDDGVGDYVELKAEETAPFDGYLLHKNAMVKLITEREKEIGTLKLTLDSTEKKLQLDIETITKKKDLELQINKEMYDGLLKIKQDRVDQLSSQQKWGDVKLFLGVVVGIGITLGVLSAAVQVSK
jgi:glutamate-1-semialdehyde aminotransferase